MMFAWFGCMIVCVCSHLVRLGYHEAFPQSLGLCITCSHYLCILFLFVAMIWLLQVVLFEVVVTFAWFVVAFFLFDMSHALVFGLLRLSCVNSSTCIGWDCLLACSCCWVCLPCVQLLCFLQWPVIGALRIFTLGSFRPELCFVCHTRFLCGLI